ncbi:hypothetical protein Tsubulata_025994 [Turnera subulata]|uniref:DUF4408 domain-containing protein n=1 Tax=Turnera subulata TaxID=218843 RepID=A0A9Q0J881_9ROSI|nr:hypothetical protein Tsubulata_025994 [Turnera subulata]
MADANYYTKLQQQSQASTSKLYSHFLYKALIVTIFLVILPLFPSQAPEFINQTLNTRGWEFLHLVFVGIAVSYGLFSKRNEETEKENSSSNNPSKFDNAQSYVSRFLQVSSVFDDETDHSPPRSDTNKVQTWSSQYYRNEPVVVVAEDHSSLEKEQRGISSRIGEKPLLLPVRSLKSRVVDGDVNETSKESSTGVPGSISRSNSGSKRFSSSSSKRRNGEFGGLEKSELEEKVKDNVVLPSPIPWRSRSGRMEMKEGDNPPPLYDLPPSMEEPENNRSFKAQVSRSSRSSSTNSSPKLSPSPSMSSPRKSSSPSPPLSTETQGKIAEDFVRKKGFYRSPPPPPPPPPPMIRRSSSMKPTFCADDDDDQVIVGKDLKRLVSEPKDFRGANMSMPKSVRTLRGSDSFVDKEFDDGFKTKSDKRSKEVEAAAMERAGKKTAGFDHQSSFRSERLNREHVTFKSQPTFMEFPEEEKEEFLEKMVMESDDDSETEEDDEIARNSFASGVATTTQKEEPSSGTSSDGGPDVDKKADEFIAKFREQIRLQRIESIKQSSAQISKKASR